MINQIAAGVFSPSDKARYLGLASRLYEHDYFLVTCDFDSYYAMQRVVDVAYRDTQSWTRLTALNTARVGWFSSDRTIAGYARDIWNVTSGLDRSLSHEPSQ